MRISLPDFSLPSSHTDRPKRRRGLALLATRSVEAVLAAGLMGFFSLLPFRSASDLGGRLGRTVGPLLPQSRRAERNLQIAFPEKSKTEIAGIVRGMWDNLGRVLAEYPHLHRIDIYGSDSPIEVVGAEHIDALRDDGKPGLVVTAHLGNWEIVPPAVVQRGIRFTYFYRTLNNPAVDRILKGLRHERDVEQIPKGAEGVRRAFRLLSAGGHLGLLADLRTNEGIAIPFFGRPAMTAPASAQLALRFDCPVVLMRVERLGGARFRVTCLPAIHARKSGDTNRDVAEFMTEITAVIEGWIRERPEQWFWLHRRWGRKA